MNFVDITAMGYMSSEAEAALITALAWKRAKPYVDKYRAASTDEEKARLKEDLQNAPPLFLQTSIGLLHVPIIIAEETQKVPVVMEVKEWPCRYN